MKRPGRIVSLVIMAVGAVLVATLDQLVKAWISSNLAAGESRTIIDGFARLRYTQNTGAAFGFFQGWTGALSIGAIAILVAIVLSASRMGSGSRLMMLALGLVTGGALGNLIDRLRLGYVVDFFDIYGPRVHFNNTFYTWPVFNVADSAISIGVVLLMWGFIFGKQEPAQEPKRAHEAAVGALSHPAGKAVEAADHEQIAEDAGGIAGGGLMLANSPPGANRKSPRF